MRGMDGPVRSMSNKPTLAFLDRFRSDRASWTETDDFPTPPLPDRTSMICLTCFSRRLRAGSLAMVLPEELLSSAWRVCLGNRRIVDVFLDGSWLE